jgi:hypothetical protein
LWGDLGKPKKKKLSEDRLEFFPMSGAIPPLPNTPSWRGAQLKKEAQGQLYLYLLTLMYILSVAATPPCAIPTVDSTFQ